MSRGRRKRGDRDANFKQLITIKTSVDGKDEITAKRSQKQPLDASDEAGAKIISVGSFAYYAKLPTDNKQTNKQTNKQRL